MITSKLINKLNKIPNLGLACQNRLFIMDNVLSCIDSNYNKYSVKLENNVCNGYIPQFDGDFLGDNIQIIDNKLKSSLRQLEIINFDTEDFKPDSQDFSDSGMYKLCELRDLEYSLNGASTYDINSILGGINFHTLDNKIVIASTDGNILNYFHTKNYINDYSDENLEFNFTIPLQGLKKYIELVKITDKNPEIYFSLSKCKKYIGLATMQGVTCELKLLQGTYPKVKQLLPSDKLDSLVFDFKDFSDNVNNVIKLSGKNPVPVFRLTHDSLVYNDSILPLKNRNTSTEFKIHFNSKLFKRVLDSLKIYKPKTITLDISGNLSPLLVKTEVNEATSLIMPIKRND